MIVIMISFVFRNTACGRRAKYYLSININIIIMIIVVVVVEVVVVVVFGILSTHFKQGA